ncbi:MAG: BppU family phage baseplate upper protein [Clostridia bacterium]|nr:BppU family phage baseplate upper protein [Clostridia bacterium]
MVEYNIRIELQSERLLDTEMEFTTGDVKAYRLVFKFFSGGRPFDVSGCSLTVKAKRADGVVIVDKGEINEEGVAFYDVKTNLYAVSGTMKMEIALLTENGGYITAKELTFHVRKGYGDGELTPANTTPILSALMTQAAKAEKATIEAEKLANMGVVAEMLDSGSMATAEKVDDGERIVLRLGIPQGLPGYTPVKGEDYFTEAEKTEMVQAVLAALPDGDEVSY